MKIHFYHYRPSGGQVYCNSYTRDQNWLTTLVRSEVTCKQCLLMSIRNSHRCEVKERERVVL